MTYKIFMPFDGSSCSLRALQHAVAMAQRISGSSLHIASAHEEPLIVGELAVYVPRDKMEKIQREHGEAVLERAEPIAKVSGVPYDTETLIGPVAQVLAERARTVGCDAIVMGTRGMTALGNVLMGSVASKLVHLSDLPLTLVK